MPVTSPITVAGTSQRAQMARKRSTSPGAAMAIIRSCDSLMRISAGPSEGSRSGTASSRIAIPEPPPAASSAVAQEMPAAPRSWMPFTSPAAPSSRQHSTSNFSMNGSPTWTLGRFADSPPPNEALASTEAPPIPSGPVRAPKRMTLLPSPLAAASWRSSCRMTPTHSAFTSGFPA